MTATYFLVPIEGEYSYDSPLALWTIIKRTYGKPTWPPYTVIIITLYMYHFKNMMFYLYMTL